MTPENPENVMKMYFLLFGWWIFAKKKLIHPRTKIPQGCSEEWKFEASAPEGIAEERSSVVMEKRTGVVCFLA